MADGEDFHTQRFNSKIIVGSPNSMYDYKYISEFNFEEWAARLGSHVLQHYTVCGAAFHKQKLENTDNASKHYASAGLVYSNKSKGLALIIIAWALPSGQIVLVRTCSSGGCLS